MNIECLASCPWCGPRVLCQRNEIGVKGQTEATHKRHKHLITLNGKNEHYIFVGKFRVRISFGSHEWAEREVGLLHDPNPEKETTY